MRLFGSNVTGVDNWDHRHKKCVYSLVPLMQASSIRHFPFE